MRGSPLIQCSEDPCLDAFPSPSSVGSGAGAPAKPEDDMIRLAIVMAFLLSQVDLAAARGGGGPPRFDIKATCRSAQPISNYQDTYKDCITEETQAHSEMVKSWSTFSASARSTCVQEIQLGTSPSYVDMLTCLQLAMEAAVSARQNAKPLNAPPP